MTRDARIVMKLQVTEILSNHPARQAHTHAGMPNGASANGDNGE
jgi:hypothetical protein